MMHPTLSTIHQEKKMLQVLLLLGLCVSIRGQDLSCSKDFCNEFTTKNECPDLPAECKIQNSTHNGLVLPHQAPCNCCKFCLKNNDEGEDCAVGSPTSQVPNNICGKGLKCEKSKCVTIDTSCTKAQSQYDLDRKTGKLGHLQLRPNCDSDGQYQSYNCIPGEICYCVDEEGNRIFGEIPFTTQAKILLTCTCSRAINRISKFLGKPVQRHEALRCQADGSYDPIQCVENKCMCVDGWNGKPSDYDFIPIEMTQISEKSLNCFDKSIHMEFDYYRACEDKYIRIINGVKEMEEQYEVSVFIYPQCQQDGYYAAVQKNDTHKYCVEPTGNIMNHEAALSTPAADNMDCNCARANLLMQHAEKPVCCSNGNYRGIQCRRGLCRCVDRNGNQIKKEVPEAEKLELKCGLSCWDEE